MNPDEYIKSRLEDQLEWYSKKSQRNQRWYKSLRVTEAICAATIPLLSGCLAADTIGLRVTIGLLGSAIAVITAVLSICRFQENWVEYRTTSETLKHEKFLFLTGTGPYDISEPFPLLVERVESLISKENTSWAQYIRTTKEK